MAICKYIKGYPHLLEKGTDEGKYFLEQVVLFIGLI